MSGLDGSSYQTVYDPSAIRGAGVEFAWWKATQGTGYRNSNFPSAIAELRGAGITVGAYHYADGSGSPGAQAVAFHHAASATIGPGCLFPMLDMEDASVRASANAFVTAFYDVLNAGCLVVYANFDWWTNVLRPSNWGGRNIVGAIAHYNGDPGNPGWSYPRMAVHQYSETGQVPGISTVDLDCLMPGWSLNQITTGLAASSLEDDMGIQSESYPPTGAADAKGNIPVRRHVFGTETASVSSVIGESWCWVKSGWGPIKSVRILAIGSATTPGGPARYLADQTWTNVRADADRCLMSAPDGTDQYSIEIASEHEYTITVVTKSK